jgi:hypothetical protein
MFVVRDADVSFVDARMQPVCRKWSAGNKWKFLLMTLAMGRSLRIIRTPWLPGPPRNPFFKKLSKPFVWAPESS